MLRNVAGCIFEIWLNDNPICISLVRHIVIGAWWPDVLRIMEVICLFLFCTALPVAFIRDCKSRIIVSTQNNIILVRQIWRDHACLHMIEPLARESSASCFYNYTLFVSRRNDH